MAAVRRRLAATVCAATLGVAGMATTTIGAAHADTTTTDQAEQVQALLGDAQLTPAATSAIAQADATEFAPAADAAIDPTQYQCDDNTQLFQWLRAQAGSADVMSELAQYDVFDIPEYYALFFETDATPQPLGPNGELTSPIGTEVAGLEKFWDFDGSAIQLVNMKGSVLDDEAKVSQTVQVMYGVDKATADQVAPIFMDWARQMPGGTSNPYFSFNAFAFDGTSLGLGVKIIVGDGIAEVYDALGLEPIAMQQVIAHEYGHQVQYHDGLTATSLTGPEQSRRLELMADALGAYYLTHVKGLNLNAKRLRSAAESAYQVGDCSYTSATHHGTPLQRVASVNWAIGLTNNTTPQSVIWSGKRFGAAFDQELPTLVAPTS